jgi:hypothetical protein
VPVLVGVEVGAQLAAAQPHVVPVVELLHRSLLSAGAARWR